MRQRQKYQRPLKLEKRPRVNEQIKVPEVLLISDEGAAEKMPIEKAIERAKAAELDLIEVSPKAVPPVVKIGDIGHFMYQLQKKEKKQKSHAKIQEVKMLRFGFRTEKHDIDRLIDRAREFLEDRDMVKFVVRLRGRENTNKDFAAEKMRGVLEALREDSEVEQELKLQGNQFIAVVRPKSK